jgi:hypothetical protein
MAGHPAVLPALAYGATRRRRSGRRIGFVLDCRVVREVGVAGHQAVQSEVHPLDRAIVRADGPESHPAQTAGTKIRSSPGQCLAVWQTVARSEKSSVPVAALSNSRAAALLTCPGSFVR